MTLNPTLELAKKDIGYSKPLILLSETPSYYHPLSNHQELLDLLFILMKSVSIRKVMII